MLSRERGERRGGLLRREEGILEPKEVKENQRGKKKDFLRENLEKGVDLGLGILDFLKKSRAILHSKELNINPPSLRAKLGASKGVYNK